jgi:hypothetical protein
VQITPSLGFRRLRFPSSFLRTCETAKCRSQQFKIFLKVFSGVLSAICRMQRAHGGSGQARIEGPHALLISQPAAQQAADETSKEIESLWESF